jgi:hypothetical protein
VRLRDLAIRRAPEQDDRRRCQFSARAVTVTWVQSDREPIVSSTKRATRSDRGEAVLEELTNSWRRESLVEVSDGQKR